MKIYQGTVASSGIAIGNACIIEKQEQISIPKRIATPLEKETGWPRFEKAIDEVTEYYKNLMDGSNKEQKDVIQTYLLMLSDSEFISQIKNLFEKTNFCIEHCIKTKIEETTIQLRAVGDEYLSERAQDIEDVFNKVLMNMLGLEQNLNVTANSDSIVIAESLTPSQAMSLFKKGIKGLVLQDGGISSHISILARTYGIPSLFGIKNPCSIIQNDLPIIIDTTKSLIIAEPDKTIRTDYVKKIDDYEKEKKELKSFIKKKGITKDGTEIKIFANISSVEDAKIALDEGADGIGLFRTEFLFMDSNSKIVSENEQYKVYKEVLQIMKGKPVTIRTLDCGGDKFTSLNEGTTEEKNPLLGCRAIRFCLDHKELFKTQLKALYRASVHGNLKILIPMVTGMSQVRATLDLISEIQSELIIEEIPFEQNVPLGIMIETPAAAIMADEFSEKCDFFSIGSNDLVQYLIAVDRENASVSKLYNEMHPAVMRLLRYTINCAKNIGIPISICGEMASRQETIKTLLGLGIRNLSVNPRTISSIKKFLLSVDIKEIQKMINATNFEQKLRLFL